jgi:hypothetical protein
MPLNQFHRHIHLYSAADSNILTNIELLKLVKYRKPLAMNTITTLSTFTRPFFFIPPEDIDPQGANT